MHQLHGNDILLLLKQVSGSQAEALMSVLLHLSCVAAAVQPRRGCCLLNYCQCNAGGIGGPQLPLQQVLEQQHMLERSTAGGSSPNRF